MPESTPLSAEKAALLSTDQRIELAGRALATLDQKGEVAGLNASALADRIDRLTGVGFEAATLVVLASGYRRIAVSQPAGLIGSQAFLATGLSDCPRWVRAGARPRRRPGTLAMSFSGT